MIRLNRISGALLISAGLLSHAAPADAEPATVVAELYTSQGCNSCPPADALLGDLSKREGVVALSFHVPYWDYLGWKDPFAKREHKIRQYAYRTAMRIRAVYTPQLIVQGRSGVIGSRRAQVDAALTKYRNAGAAATVSAKREAGGLTVNVAPATAAAVGPAEIWAVRFDPVLTTEIRRGENAGKTLTYHNVVRDLRSMGRWSGASAETFTLALEDHPKSRYAVIVQRGADDGEIGPILGAAVAVVVAEQ